MNFKETADFLDENAGIWVGVSDKKLLWRANLYIDEGENDWNNLNRWTYANGNEWDKDWFDYDDDNIINEAGPYNGGQCTIKQWTHPEHIHYRVDDNGNITSTVHWTVTCSTINNAVAYAWGASDTLFHFNEDMDEQRIAMTQVYNSDHDQWPNWNITTAPGNNWSNYLTSTYRPAYSILTHCNQTNPAGSDLAEEYEDRFHSAGTDCCGFVTRVVSYENMYEVRIPDADEKEVFNDTGDNRPYISIDGTNGFEAESWYIPDINLLVPGDIVYMYTPSPHIAIVNKINYTSDNSRTTTTSNIHFIETTTWGYEWNTQNDQTAETYILSGYSLYYGRLMTE